MAELNFDATTVEPDEPFKVIPAGVYPAQIIASEWRMVKDKDGRYLWLELEILDGEHKGRKIWDRLNLENVNPKAVEIAQRALSAISRSLGLAYVRDSEEMHLKPMLVTVRVKPGEGQYSAYNEIRGYEPMGGARPAVVATQATATPAAQPAAAAKTPPWRANKAS